MNFNDYPILKILIPYILGVLITYFGGLTVKNEIILFLLPVVLCLIAIVLYPKLGFKRQWIAGTMLQISFIFVGIINTNFQFSHQLSSTTEALLNSNTTWLAKVVEHPVIKEKSVKVTVQIEATADDKPVKTKALLYFHKNSDSQQITFGDLLIIQGKLRPIDPAKNPDAFNNQLFLKRKGIYFTSYINRQNWAKLDHKSNRFIKDKSHHLQQYFAHLFEKAGMSGDEYSIINAILLGNDDTVEGELKSAYSSAGVSHILCVSGMHVGIIFMILNFLLQPLELFHRTRFLKAAILIATIWLYANITGLSPSVSRAATMFSFVTLGGMLRRNNNIFHSLFASLFLLLCYKPLLLFELGFELSYLAVFGIVLFQKPINKLYSPKTKFGKYVWELMTVSVAAQLSTFPLSIYYFGQFPNYFLLANLSVITLSFIIVISGVIVLSFSFIPFIANKLAFILTHEIKLMNSIITTIEKIPGAVTPNITISAIQVILLYLLIILIYCFIQKKTKTNLWLLYGIFTIYSCSYGVVKIKQLHRKEIIIYSINKESAINFINGKQSVLLSDSIKDKKRQSYHYHIESHERKKGFTSELVSMDTNYYTQNDLLKIGYWFYSHGNRFYLLTPKNWNNLGVRTLTVDYLIFHGNPRVNFSALIKKIQFKELIIDESNNIYNEKRWIDSCKLYKINYYATRQSGYKLIMPYVD